MGQIGKVSLETEPLNERVGMDDYICITSPAQDEDNNDLIFAFRSDKILFLLDFTIAGEI